MARESYAELVVTTPFPLFLPWEKAEWTWQLVEPSCQACQKARWSQQTLPPAGTSVSALVVWGGGEGYLMSWHQCFCPEAQVVPGGSMDSLGR